MKDRHDHYKERFFKYFMYDGDYRKQGTNIPAKKRMYDNRSILKFGDSTISLAYYIIFLTTEAEIQRKEGKSYKDTLLKLKNAIKTLERLDSVAEKEFRNNNKKEDKDLNGFFIRDDVNDSYIDNIEKKDKFGELERVISDFIYKGDGKFMKEMSQDQYWHLLQGLYLTYTYVNNWKDTKYGIEIGGNIKESIITIVDRITNYISNECNWIIKNPVLGKKVYRGADARLFSYGFWKISKLITNKNYNKNILTNRIFFKLVYYFAELIYGPLYFIWPNLRKKNVDYSSLISTMNLFGERTLNKMVKSVIRHDQHYHLPLLNSLIWNNEIKNSDIKNDEYIKKMINYLNNVPEKDIYYFDEYNNSGNEWLNKGSLAYPKNDKKEINIGVYNGLDYLCLYNMCKLCKFF